MSKVHKFTSNILCILMLLVCLTVPFIVEVDAEEIQGYEIKVEDLDKEVQKYISSIYLQKRNDNWRLIVNNDTLEEKSSDNLVYYYAPNSGFAMSISIDLDNLVASIHYTKTTQDSVTSAFVFKMKNGVQTVYFYPKSDENAIIRESKKDEDGYYDFGSFSYGYKGKTITFNLKVNTKTNKAIIYRGGKEYYYDLTSKGVSQMLFCEDLIPAQELNLNYMETSLEKQIWTKAQTITYTDEEVDNALSNHKITLKNNATGLTTEQSLSRALTYWKRNEGSGTEVGDGTYQSTQESIQVVCQWNEGLCASIREEIGEANRPFAVYGSDETYKYLSSYTKTMKATLYKVATWEDSNWSSESPNYPTLGNYTAVQYRTRSISWTEYSPYTYESPSVKGLEQGSYIEKTRTMYAYRTRLWGEWSDYIYSAGDVAYCDGTTCEKQGKAKYNIKKGTYTSWSEWSNWKTNSCTSDDLTKCESKVQYRYKDKKANGNWQVSWSSWSDTKYTASSTRQVDTRTVYRKATRKVEWGNWSEGFTYDSCEANSTTQCWSKYVYRKRELGGWSEYLTNVDAQGNYTMDSCEITELKKCESQVQYSYKYKDTSGWSNWKYTTKDVGKEYNSKKYDVQYRSNEGIVTSSSVKGNSNTLGVGRYDTKETIEKKADLEVVKSEGQAYDTSMRMTKTEVEAFAEKIKKDEAEAITIENASDQGIYYLKSDFDAGLVDVDYSLGNKAKTRFYNQNRFIPYIFIIKHYRATTTEFIIEGYDDEKVEDEVILLEDTNGSKDNITLYPVDLVHRNTKVIYIDYKDPLKNYDEVPENWKGYEALVEEIKNSDLGTYKIQVTLTESDIEDMRTWIKNNPNKVGTGEMLKAFSYIFTGTNNEMAKWLSGEE